MSKVDETFFTTVGCMDGRVEEPVVEFGRKKFGAKYPDTITEAGLVGQLSRTYFKTLTSFPRKRESRFPVKLGMTRWGESLLDSIKNKLLISLKKHHSKGIIVHGHEGCVGNPVDDEKHKDDIRKSIRVIQGLINSPIPVIGVFVKRSSKYPSKWEIEEV